LRLLNLLLLLAIVVYIVHFRVDLIWSFSPCYLILRFHIQITLEVTLVLVSLVIVIVVVLVIVVETSSKL
jgi:hypothetical protein